LISITKLWIFKVSFSMWQQLWPIEEEELHRLVITLCAQYSCPRSPLRNGSACSTALLQAHLSRLQKRLAPDSASVLQPQTDHIGLAATKSVAEERLPGLSLLKANISRLPQKDQEFQIA